MSRTFNCGVGFVLITDSQSVSTVLTKLCQAGARDATVIGSVISLNTGLYSTLWSTRIYVCVCIYRVVQKWVILFMDWNSLCLHFNGLFPGEPGLAGFIGARDDGQIITTNKPAANFYRADVLSITQPTASEHWRKNTGLLLSGIM